MSITSEISRITRNIAAAYTSCDGKGATLPQTRNSQNLADTIDSIVTGGTQPSLYPPVISRSGATLLIHDPAANGSYVSGFDIYDAANEIVLASVSADSFDLSTLPAGTYEIAVKAKGQHFDDSVYSNRICISVCSITRELTDLTADNATGKIVEGMPYTVTLTPAAGSYLPEDIAVTMGGAATDAYAYDSYTGAVNIFGVTANVVITAAALSVNKLRRPVLSLSGSSLTVTPPLNAVSTSVSVNGTPAYTLSGTTAQTFDLSQTCAAYGMYAIAATASASGYTDSDPSSLTYRAGVEIAISGSVVTLPTAVSGVMSFKVYVDGVLADTVAYDGSASWNVDMADYESGMSAGKHAVELEAVGTGIAANRSNTVSWYVGVAPIYGVSGLYNSEPALTRTGASVGMSYLINSSTGAVESDFDEVFPWNRTQIVYTEAGKFVSFPEMFFRIGTDSSSRITDVAVSELPSGSGSWYKVEPFLYGCYGASVANNKMKSVSGVSRTSATRAAYRTAAMNNSGGYIPIDLYHRNVLILLWWIEFATKNSAAIMTGNVQYSGLSEKIELQPCGDTDCVNTPSGFEVLNEQMRYHYIEDFVGNNYELIDGVYPGGSNERTYVTADPLCFSERSDDKSALPWQNPYLNNREITAFGWDTDNPFLFMPITTVVDNNYNLYFCDATALLSGYPALYGGCSYETGTKQWGLHYLSNTGAYASGNYMGSRLLKIK